MGKKMTKKQRQAEQQHQRRRKYLRAGVMGVLVVAGLGMMAGMAAFNGSAKPNRDMQWYVREGAVQVAAPAMGEGYEADANAATAGLESRRETVAQPEEAASGPVLADITAEPTKAATDVPTEAPTDVPTAQPTEAPEPEATPEADTGTVTIKITAAGDCTFGGEEGAKGRRRFLDLVEKYGYDYFFNGVRAIFEDDDLTIVNLEGPLTSVEKPGKHGGFIFKGDPEYVNILTGSSVEVCNLANNHTLDYGKAGLKETAQVLSDNGVGYCGFTQEYRTEIKGVRVCALGYTWWDASKAQIVEAVAAARETCDLLIVNMHWGWESHNDRDDKQADWGHAIVDAGADLVIGTHPHVYQGIEKYKGKYIVYSLGNLCFAGNANPADKRCLIFQQTFSFNPGMGIAQANILDAGINVIPCTVSSVRDKNDFQPNVMPAEPGAALLKAVASRSTNFSLTDSLWMKDNYMLTYGLIKPKEQLDANGDPVTADVQPEATQAPDAGADAVT